MNLSRSTSRRGSDLSADGATQTEHPPGGGGSSTLSNASPDRPPATRERRGSFDGPSVPLHFREAAAAESSKSHEFRQKLMRLVVGTNRTQGASTSASAQASPGLVHLSEAANAAAVDGAVHAASSSDGFAGAGVLGMSGSGGASYVP